MEIDNVFYEARGSCWALLHILRAIKHDFSDILLDKRAMNTLDNMIQALENALTPTLSPVVLNGDGFGILPTTRWPWPTTLPVPMLPHSTCAT